MLSSTPGNATTTTVVTQTATATGSHSSPQSSSALFLLAASAHFAGVWARVGGWCPNPDGAPTPMVPVQGPEQLPPPPRSRAAAAAGRGPRDACKDSGSRARGGRGGERGGGGGGPGNAARARHPRGRPSSLPHPSSRPRLVAAGLRRAGNQGAARRRRGAAARRAEVGRRAGTGRGGAGSARGDPHGATPAPLPPSAPLSSRKVLWGRSGARCRR